MQQAGGCLYLTSPAGTWDTQYAKGRLWGHRWLCTSTPGALCPGCVRVQMQLHTRSSVCIHRSVLPQHSEVLGHSKPWDEAASPGSVSQW